jgi:hypothetical protein
MFEPRDAGGETLLVGIALILIFGWLLWALAEGSFPFGRQSGSSPRGGSTNATHKHALFEELASSDWITVAAYPCRQSATVCSH